MKIYTRKPVRRLQHWLFLCASLLLVSAGCTGVSTPTPLPYTSTDAESILRAYFNAWERGDWLSQLTFMDSKYAGMAPEPVESIQLVDVRPFGVSSETQKTFKVIFIIKVKGQGVSMKDGRYVWTYTMSWDKQRNSWLISNYGAG